MTPPTTTSVWTELGADLRRFIRRRVSDEHLAEDLLQETFLRIHRSLGTLADTDRLAAWVYQVARNVIRDHYRKSSHHTIDGNEVDAPDELDETTPPLPCRTGDWQEELIRQLPDGYRQAVQLSEREGLPQHVVAERLGLSLSAAKSRIQRGRTMLKQALHECCTFEFDRRGNLLDVEPRPDRTVCRGCLDDLEYGTCGESQA